MRLRPFFTDCLANLQLIQALNHVGTDHHGDGQRRAGCENASQRQVLEYGKSRINGEQLLAQPHQHAVAPPEVRSHATVCSKPAPRDPFTQMVCSAGKAGKSLCKAA